MAKPKTSKTPPTAPKPIDLNEAVRSALAQAVVTIAVCNNELAHAIREMNDGQE